MVKRKSGAVCMICSADPCECFTTTRQPRRVKADTAITAPAPEIVPPVTSVVKPAIRKISTPHPQAISETTVIQNTATPSRVPQIVNRHAPARVSRSVIEILEILAIQLFYKSGLIDDSQFPELLAVKLTPQERALAWREQTGV